MRVPSLLVLAACVLSPACDGAHAGVGSTGVLLIAVDGLRADHVGANGYDRDTTPELDQLAGEGLLFTDAFAAAPLPRPSHAGILTGCDPYVSQRFVSPGMSGTRFRVPAQVPRLAVEFLAAGYRTAAFVSERVLGGDLGYARGFQRFVTLDGEELGPGEFAGAQVRRLMAWLRGVGSKSWFAYVQLEDLERSWARPLDAASRYFEARAELDYVPPVGGGDDLFFMVPYSRWRGGSHTLGEYEAAYDGHLRWLDGELGALFAGLRRLELDESTTIVVVGTHGTQLGEAGLYLKSGCYSLADLAVPWIVRPRAELELARGTRVDSLASLVDVAPTLLALEGLRVPGGTHGRALLSPGGPGPRPHVFASCGLLQGGVVIGERHCFEFSAPGQLGAGDPLRSWNGEPPGLGGDEAVVRFYDRHETPFPPLSERIEGRRQGVPFGTYRTALDRWLATMRDLRAVLQLGGIRITEERMQELAAQGYLSSEALD